MTKNRPLPKNPEELLIFLLTSVRRTAYWPESISNECGSGNGYWKDDLKRLERDLKTLADTYPFIERKPDNKHMYFVNRLKLFQLYQSAVAASPVPMESTYIELCEYAGIL